MIGKTAIKEFIEKELTRGKVVTDLKATDNLIESGIVDSLGIQLLVSFLEKKFSVTIADDELMPDNFETIEAIWSFINSKAK